MSIEPMLMQGSINTNTRDIDVNSFPSSPDLNKDEEQPKLKRKWQENFRERV
eukprot:Pgem_evm1s13605